MDDRIVGTYADENEKTNPSTQFLISKDEDPYHKGQYDVIVASGSDCSMEFGGILFQIGTNRFLDLLPVIKPCDYIPANPPSYVEILQAATIQPMHMVVKVDTSTNGVRFGIMNNDALIDLSRKYPDYFRIKNGEMIRMLPDTKRQREFLLRFGGDTNIFKYFDITRRSK